MQITIEVNIKKIVDDHGQKIIYCDRPRALGEYLRYKYGFNRYAVHIWGHGVTLLPNDWNLVKGEFKDYV